MIVNETLPVLSERVLGGGLQAVVVSTILIVVFVTSRSAHERRRLALYYSATDIFPDHLALLKLSLKASAADLVW